MLKLAMLRDQLSEITSLYYFYEKVCEQYPDNIIHGSKTTYADAQILSRKRSSFLIKSGFIKGDIIGILSENSFDWIITYMAITSIGAIALPLDTNLDKKTYLTMLDKVQAKAIFVSNDFNFDFGIIKKMDISLSTNLDSSIVFSLPEIKDSDISTLLYTSGTTGDPKIVQLTHSNIYMTAIGGNEFIGVKEGSLVLSVLPLYHIYGLAAVFLSTFVTGCGYVFQPSLKGPDIVQSLKDNDINIFPAVPQLWEMFFDAILAKLKASSKLKYHIFMTTLNNTPTLQKIGLGFIPKKIFKPIHQVFGEKMDFLVSGGAAMKDNYYTYYYNMGFRISEGYGLSETTAAIFGSDRTKFKTGFSGRPLPGNEVKIKNKNSEGIGELWLRGCNVFPGYYQNEKANKEVFDEDGWFNSGDLGYLDKDGELQITGRMKNMIVLDSGKNVYPEELEAYYQDSDLISEIAVFGKEFNGREIVYAVIVPSRSDTSYLELKKEISHLNQGLPSYKVISDFAISREALPKTSKKTTINGKIIELLNQGAYETGASSQVAAKILTVSSPLSEIIIDSLKEELKQKDLYEHQVLADFGIDSLKLMSLVASLENKLSIKIDIDKLIRLENLVELVAYLESCESGEKSNSITEDILTGEITTKARSFYNPFVELFLLFFRIIAKILWRSKVYNKENLNIKNNIVVLNHQSFLDIVLLYSAIPYKYRKKTFLTGKKELSFIRFIVPGIAIIFVDRHNNTMPTLKAGADILRMGYSLIIFPEGTRTRDGKLGVFKPGAAFLAKNLKKEIIPITINGAYQIKKKKKLFPKLITRHKATLTVHPKIDSSKYINENELNSHISNTIDSALIK